MTKERHDVASQAVGEATHEVLDRMARGATEVEAVAAAVAHLGCGHSLDGIVESVRRAVTWSATAPDRPSLIHSEFELAATLDGVPMMGRADTVEGDPDGVLVIGDYKTGCSPSPVEVEDGGVEIFGSNVTRQCVMYAEMAEESGVHIGRVRVYFLGDRKVVEVDLDSERGQRLRVEARRHVVYTAERLGKACSSGFFQARPSPARCAGCAFQHVCEFSAVVPAAVLQAA